MWWVQRRIGQLERQSTELRSWQPDVVPGLLQTRDYTAALIGEVDEGWWAARQARQAMLSESGRMVHQLLSEAALRWVVGSRDVMRGQLEYLAEASRRDGLRFGVVPFGQTAAPPPEGAFHLYGDRVAVVATAAGTTFVDDRDDLDMFRRTFDLLDEAAIYGDDARDLLDRAARIRRST